MINKFYTYIIFKTDEYATNKYKFYSSEFFK